MTAQEPRRTLRPQIQFSVERQRADQYPPVTTVRLDVRGEVTDDELVRIVGDELARAAARQTGTGS